MSLPSAEYARLNCGLLVPGAMQLVIVAKRVSSLPPHLLDVAACVSEGMSNGQVAERLGYKNARTVGTLVCEINKKLGLDRDFLENGEAATSYRCVQSGAHQKRCED